MSQAPAVFTVLGSGTLLPDALRRSAAFLLESEGASVLLDCGPGTLHGLAEHGVEWRGLTHVVISHYHLDHVGDLSALLFALKHGVGRERTRPLTLVGPRGFGTFLERLAGALGDHVVDPGFDVDVVELGEGDVLEEPRARLRLWAHPTPHTAGSLAFKLEVPGGTVGYSGDTGPSAEVARFLAGCDVLVLECAQDDPPAGDNHLSPATAAGMAALAAPGLLVLTHVYPPLTPDAAVERLRGAGYAGEVVAGRDGMRLRLPAGA